MKKEVQIKIKELDRNLCSQHLTWQNQILLTSQSDQKKNNQISQVKIAMNNEQSQIKSLQSQKTVCSKILNLKSQNSQFRQQNHCRNSNNDKNHENRNFPFYLSNFGINNIQSMLQSKQASSFPKQAQKQQQSYYSGIFRSKPIHTYPIYEGCNHFYNEDKIKKSISLQKNFLKKPAVLQSQQLSLQKKINWLKQEIEMHLQRQNKQKMEKNKIQTLLNDKEKKWQHQLQKIKIERENLKKELQLKHSLITKLNESLSIQAKQLQKIKSHHNVDFSKVIKSSINMKTISSSSEKTMIGHEKQPINAQEDADYYCLAFEKALSQNKFMKMQIHALERYKYEAIRLKQENIKLSKETAQMRQRLKSVSNAGGQTDSDQELFELSVASNMFD